MATDIWVVFTMLSQATKQREMEGAKINANIKPSRGVGAGELLHELADGRDALHSIIREHE